MLMGKLQENSKVYLEIVGKLKEIIGENQLKAGDRLPSERDLAEMLNAGRSSVREALRSLELLGLIETRRGEGTFISDFRNHRLVEILSGFILESDQAKQDVQETKELVEMMGIYSLVNRNTTVNVQDLMNQAEEDDSKLFESLMNMTGNFLLVKLWRIVSNFEQSLQLSKKKVGKQVYENLLKAINRGDWFQAMEIYSKSVRNEVEL